MLIGIIMLIVGAIVLHFLEKIYNNHLEFVALSSGVLLVSIGSVITFITVINVLILGEKYGESYDLKIKKESAIVLLNDSNVISRPDGLSVINNAISINNTIKSWKNTNNNVLYYGLAPVTSIDTIELPKFINSSEVRIKQ